MTDGEFLNLADRTLAAIGAALDAAAAQGADLDWTLNDGVLAIEADNGARLVVNRHLPNREIWVASRGGGFHFAARAGGWADTRSGAALEAVLAACLRDEAGAVAVFPKLRSEP